MILEVTKMKIIRLFALLVLTTISTLSLVSTSFSVDNCPRMTLDDIAKIAESGLGSPYWWGHGCWRPSNRNWGGADCSGYVAKCWQVPVAKDVDVDYHPYGTSNFRYDNFHWDNINSRDNMQVWDCMVYRNSANTAGHVLLFHHKGSSWSDLYVYEAYSSAAPIARHSKYVGSDYVPRRRHNLGTAYKWSAEIVNKDWPRILRAGNVGDAFVSYKNVGSEAWEGAIKLGTTGDRNRISDFQHTSWISGKRVTGVDGGQKITPVGANTGEHVGKFSFKMQAPTIAQVKTYNEHFNLVRDVDTGVTWFSDESGPKDNDLAMSIMVYPDRDYIKRWLLLDNIPGKDITLDHLKNPDDTTITEDQIIRNLWPEAGDRQYTRDAAPNQYHLWKDTSTIPDAINYGDINNLNENNTQCAKFLFVYVTANNDKPSCKMKIGATYGVQVWVNGEKVPFASSNIINPNEEKSILVDDYTTQLFSLKEGVNRLLLKVTHAGNDADKGVFKVSARIYDSTTANDLDIAGLTYSIKKPSDISLDTTPPAIPTIVSPVNNEVVTVRRPTFSWNAVTDPSTSTPVSYNLQIDSNTNFNIPVVNMTTTTTTCMINKGLVNDKYYWRLRSKDSASNYSEWTSVSAFTVQLSSAGGADITAPTNPVTVNCWTDSSKSTSVVTKIWQNVCGSNPYFEWTGATDNVGVVGYSVYLGIDKNFDPGESITVNHSAITKYTPTVNLISETTYYLRIKTVDDAWNWPVAETKFFIKFDNTAPPVPNIVSPANNTLLTTKTPTISWSAVSDISGGVKYDLRICDFSNTVVVTGPNISTTTYNVASGDITTDGAYTVKLRSQDALFNNSIWSPVPVDFKIDTQGPSAVTDLLVTNAGGGAIQLLWSESTDTVSGVKGYDIYRSASSTTKGTKIASTLKGTVSYLDPGTGLVNGNIYYYKLEPVDNAGNITVSGNNKATVTLDTSGIFVSELTIDNSNVSPNDDSVKDTLTITYTIGNTANVTLNVYNSSNTLVKTLVSNQPQTGIQSISYNCTDNSGNILADGEYTIKMSTPAVRTKKFVIDTTLPTVTKLGLSSLWFSPNSDGNLDDITINYKVSEPAKVTLKIYPTEFGSSVVRTLISDTDITADIKYQENWDGKNDNGSIVPEGSYEIRITAIDNAGNETYEPTILAVQIFLTKGVVAGYIYDSSSTAKALSARIGNATVRIEGGSVSEGKLTNNEEGLKKGYVEFVAIPSGSYTLKVSAPKYNSYTNTISVQPGVVTSIDTGLVFISTADVQSPEVTHTPLTVTGMFGNSIQVEVNIIETSDLEAQLVFVVNKKDSTSYTDSTILWRVNENSNTYHGTIDGKLITSDVVSIDYKIIATDKNGNNTRSPVTGYNNIVVDLDKEININYTIVNEVEITDLNTEDGTTKISIPANALDKDINLVIKQLDHNNTVIVPASKNTSGLINNIANPIMAYDMQPENLTFKTPVTLTLLYVDNDNDGYIDGFGTSIRETELRIFWYDPNLKDWRYIGGTVDPIANTITTKVTHFSMYGIFPIKSSMLNDALLFKPKEKVITPNSDGRNDFACFNGIHNAVASISSDPSETSKVYIYNISGKLVKTLENSDSWDGRDNNNNPVENGMYIYQYQINGKTTSGNIIIAK